MMSLMESYQPPYYFTRTSDIWDAIYADCEGARLSIEIDQYIIENDHIGRKFLSLLTEKARAGVSVRLLLDYVGSYSIYNSAPLNELESAGAHILFYNKLPKYRILQPARWFPRNHVKVALIDSDIAYVGSACMRDDMEGWRDTTVRLTGADAEPVERRMAYSRVLWWKRPLQSGRRIYQSVSGRFEFSVRSPGMGINPIYRGIIRAIRGAQQSVWVATPYFLAPFALNRAIRAAAKRGVDVKIITNARSDVRIADLVSASYFKGLMRRGIQIFSYQPFMLHAKVVIVDDDWASIGSTNIDYLSLRVNREANLIIRDASSVQTLKAHFMQDLQDSVQIPDGFWKTWPLWMRVAGYLGRSVKAVL